MHGSFPSHRLVGKHSLMNFRFLTALLYIGALYAVTCIGQNSQVQQSVLNTAINQALDDASLPTSIAVLAYSDSTRLVVEKSWDLDPSKQQVQPGSTVKPLLAYLAAERGSITPHDTLSCTGSYSANQRCFAVHGAVTLTKALANSCNAYFFELNDRMGLKYVAQGFQRFGLPKPDPSDPMSAADSAAYCFGHSGMYCSTAQLCTMYATLLDSLLVSNNNANAGVRQQILRGMRNTVSADFGSAPQARSTVAIAGKTGTAEGARTSVATSSCWFVGYAPAEKPEYIVSVMVLGGESGGKDAAPLAKRVIEALLR